jgi:hypothetical protein
MRFRRAPFARIALAGVLVLGVAACGDDDEDDVASPSASGSEAPAEGADFCGSLQEFNGAIFDTNLEDDATEADIEAAHDTLDPLWTAVEESAPEDQEEPIAELGATIDALADGDAEPFNADETSETYFTMLSEVVPDCVDETVDVTGVDYAFEAPDTFPAGEAGIIFTNDSEADEQHEFIIFKKAEGETRTAQEILEDPKTEEEGPGEFAGAVFAAPGKTAGGFLDLAAGDYLAVCFIPVGSAAGEEADGPPHFTRGMVKELAVV